MKPQHQIFIRGMITHGDKKRAYLAAYPHAKGDAIRTAAGRLLRKPFIKDAIENVLCAAREKAVQEMQEAATQQVKLKVATLEEKRNVLQRIISGEYKVMRYMKVNGRLEEVYEPVKPNTVVHAITLDAKLAGEMQAVKAKPAPPVVQTPVAAAPTLPKPLPVAESKGTQPPIFIYGSHRPVGIPPGMAEESYADMAAEICPADAGVPPTPVTVVTENEPLTKAEPFVTVSAAGSAKAVKPVFPPADLWPYFFKAFPNLAGVNEAFSRSKEEFFRRLPRSSQLSLVQGPLDKERERLFGPPKQPVRNHPQPYGGRL